jgi:hypothetical protein
MSRLTLLILPMALASCETTGEILADPTVQQGAGQVATGVASGDVATIVIGVLVLTGGAVAVVWRLGRKK